MEVLDHPPVEMHDGSIVLSIPLSKLVPSPTNPRKYFDQAALQGLAASFETHGILQPLVVRPRGPGGITQGFEIVAGERRFRAARLAKLDRVPAIVRVLTDVQVLEAQLIENGQREDIHPIEAADTFAALQKLDGSYNTRAIASKIGKSERYVQNVLHYAVLVPKAKQSFLENHINAGHADLIARLKAVDQERALRACFDNLYGEDKEKGCISVRQLDRWIKDNVRVDPIADAPQLPELQKIIDDKKGDAKAAVSTILQVSGSYSQTPATAGLMTPASYRVVEGKKNTCGHMRRALIVSGEDRGKLVDICTAKTECKVHWKYEVEELERDNKTAAKTGTRNVAGAAARKAQQKERERLKAREELSKRKLAVWSHMLDKVAPKVVPNRPTPALLALFRATSSDAGAKDWRGVTLALIEDLGGYQYATPSRAPIVVKLLKPLGIDLLAIEKELGRVAAATREEKKQAGQKHVVALKKQIAKTRPAKKRKAKKVSQLNRTRALVAGKKR